MMGLRSTAIALVAASAVAVVVPAYAGKYYKWVDAQGVTHYTEKAPENAPKEARVTTVKVGDTTSSDAEDEIKALAEKRSAAAKPKTADGATSTPPAKDAIERNQQLCDQHRKNLATLKSGVRVMIKDEQGNSNYLNGEQLKQQMETSEIEVRRCEQAKIPASTPPAAKAPASP